MLQVAWMHFEQSAILTVNKHVITRNPRITVSHDEQKAWNLHITSVQEADRGRYMCQLNTITSKTQFGYLNVVGNWFLFYFIFVPFLRFLHALWKKMYFIHFPCFLKLAIKYFQRILVQRFKLFVHSHKLRLIILKRIISFLTWT